MENRKGERKTEENQPDPRQWKVLLVDEDYQYLLKQARILRRHGLDVLPCDSYDESMIRLDSEHFDLIIVSQGSHGFEGRTVLEHVSETGSGAPVVVVATHADIPCYLEAMNLGAADYLEQPLAGSDVEKVKVRFLEARIGNA
ncbi:MAG TPA: response regulator [Terriglobia bacterium]|nr:response regulator [Terriglobia bacterium]